MRYIYMVTFAAGTKIGRATVNRQIPILTASHVHSIESYFIEMLKENVVVTGWTLLRKTRRNSVGLLHKSVGPVDL